MTTNNPITLNTTALTFAEAQLTWRWAMLAVAVGILLGLAGAAAVVMLWVYILR